jgi:tol-pal system protein YbgF
MPRFGPPFARRPGRLLPAATALLLASLPAPAVLAQTGAPTPLRIETREVQRDLGEAQQALGELPEGRATAILQNRITAIEEQLRHLTGRIEEAEFHEQQTRERIDRLVADLDRRLAAIETESRVPTEGEAGDALPESPAEATGAAAATPPEGEAEVAPDAAAREGRVLGTIPRDALLGIPAPSGDGPAGTAPAAALEGSAAARFGAALDLLQDGDYAAAEVAFDRWIADFPVDAQAPVASYWLGEAQLAQADHANAAATFAANYRTFGADAPRAADNLLKLGTALAAMGDSSRACQTFDEMARRYPAMSPGLRQALDRERRAAGCS